MKVKKTKVSFYNCLLALSILLFAGTATLCIYLKMAGLKPMLVLTDSMEPTIKTYQLIVGERVDDTEKLAPGDIITYRGPGSPATITHRIERVYKDGYIVKGDNNPAEDPFIVKREWILYKIIRY